MKNPLRIVGVLVGVVSIVIGGAVATQPARAAPATFSTVNAAVVPAAWTQFGSSFVFPDSDREYLDLQELAELSCAQLLIARNEIYARRGRYFERGDLTRYFSQFRWYRPHTWDPPLNRFEGANITLITQSERRC
jgi:hypothetical protein